ncbi:MAG: hypothetical protein GF317_03800, partial [Candidatus Lokiarchaeota archaeon]|nr:hypothetical protein [Candidatus Lokiarchaeota archaeon]MBD3199012.1 hypothetical protein [Candidatus Lokiarchaeota archaeon]
MGSKISRFNYNTQPPQLVAYIRRSAESRSQIRDIVNDLLQEIPGEFIEGNVVCTFFFITDIKNGFDVEISIPIKNSYNNKSVKTKEIGTSEYLSYIHQGSIQELQKSQELLFSFAYSLGLNSDEFMREVYLDNNDPAGNQIEIQLMIHNWESLFETNLIEILGSKKAKKVLDENAESLLDVPLAKRYESIKNYLKKMKEITTEEERFEIISKCSHIFPKNMIEKLRIVYQNALQTQKPISAIDETLRYMSERRAWGVPPKREGYIMFTSKKPRKPEEFNKAETKAEKMAAYCYCAIIRDMYGEGMDPEFCKCGAGWPRQIWEGILERKIKVDV